MIKLMPAGWNAGRQRSGAIARAIVAALCWLAAGLPVRAADPIRIGALIALSGPASFLGDPERKSLDLIVEQRNRAGGLAGHPIELVVYDTEGNGTKAAQLFRRLIDSDGVHVVIGPSTTAESLLIKPTAAEVGIPVLSMGGSEAIATPVEPFMFKVPPDDRIVARHMLGYLKAKGLRSVGLISATDSFGQAGANVLKELAPSFGVAVASAEEFGPRDTDMTAQVLRLRASGAEAMLIWSVNPGPTIILRNAKALGYDKPIFNSYGVATQQLFTQAGPAAEDTYVSSMRILAPDSLAPDDPLRAVVTGLSADYLKRYSREAPTFAAHSHDAVLAVEQALGRLKGTITRQGLRDALETAEFPGANGLYRMSPTNHSGLDDASRPMIMLQIRQGRFVRVE